MEKKLKYLMSMVAIAIISALTVGCIDLRRPTKPVEEAVVEEYIEEEITPQQAAENMLLLQKQYVWDNKCDSVFLVMPRKIVSYITLHNPGFGPWEIGNEYLKNKSLYDKLNSDVNEIQEFELKIKPDSLPLKTKPDIKTKPVDTIPTTILLLLLLD